MDELESGKASPDEVGAPEALAALTAAAAQGPVIFLYVLDDETPGEWKLGGASRWWLHHSLDRLDTSKPAVAERIRLRTPTSSGPVCIGTATAV